MKQQEFFNKNKLFFIDDRDKIARYVEEHCLEDFEFIRRTADDVVNKRFMFNLRWDMERTYEPVVFEREIDWLYQPGDDPEWIFAFNRMRFWICLGQAYAVTKDEKYAEAFVSQLVSWIYNVRREEPRAEKAWRTIEAGIRMEYWFKAIQYFEGSPALTEEVIDKFVFSMTEHAEFIMGVWNSYNLMSNWGVLANHGLFIAGVMLPDTPRTAEYRQEALRRLDKEIRMQVFRDGMQWEQSPMYHNEVAHDFLDVVLLAKRNGIPLPAAIETKTREMCYADLYSRKPDGNELSMGDSDEIDMRDIITKGAYIYRDSVLKSGGYEQLDFDCVWDLGFKAVEEYCSITGVNPGQSSFALMESGNFYFRNDWSKDSTFLHFRSGTLGAGHGHSDQLHFDLYSRGEDILIDSGRYTYVNKPERYEFKDPAAHNTCTVDSKNFIECTDSWGCSKLYRPVNQKFYASDKYCYTEGGHLGYYDLEQGGVFVNRRIIYIKPDIIIIDDEFYSTGKHTYQQYFHFNNSGKVSRNFSRYIFKSDANLVEILPVREDISCRLAATRLSRHYNQTESNVTLKTDWVAEGFTSAFTIISLNSAESAETIEIKKLPVYSNFKGIRFKDSQIEALSIMKGERKYTVAVAHEEYASPTDTFLADGCTGYGNVVVFDHNDDEKEIGTVLLW